MDGGPVADQQRPQQCLNFLLVPGGGSVWGKLHANALELVPALAPCPAPCRNGGHQATAAAQHVTGAQHLTGFEQIKQTPAAQAATQTAATIPAAPSCPGPGCHPLAKQADIFHIQHWCCLRKQLCIQELITLPPRKCSTPPSLQQTLHLCNITNCSDGHLRAMRLNFALRNIFLQMNDD